MSDSMQIETCDQPGHPSGFWAVHVHGADDLLTDDRVRLNRVHVLLDEYDAAEIKPVAAHFVGWLKDATGWHRRD